ncbi:MAG: hypothetical protein ACOCW9_00700 [Thermodesulfobacteriota bacterium]
MAKSLILKNDISEIRRLHRSVIRFAEQNRLGKDLIADIRLVMEEVFSNIVQYELDEYLDRMQRSITGEEPA